MSVGAREGRMKERYPFQDQWDAALRRQFSENVAGCRAATPMHWRPDPWERCVLFLKPLISMEPERIAYLDIQDLITVMEHGSAGAKEAAMSALAHVRDACP